MGLDEIMRVETNDGISDLTRRGIYWQLSHSVSLKGVCVCVCARAHVWCQGSEKAVWESWRSSLPENDDAGTLILDLGLKLVFSCFQQGLLQKKYF